MLRLPRVSLRRLVRSVACGAVVVLSLVIGPPALAATSVVVVGPEGSPRVTAIAAELRARGFDVVTKDGVETVESNASVHVDADGSVRVVVARGADAERRETFSARETDAIVARRVAETLRVPTAAVEPEPPAAASAPPAASEGQAPTPSVSLGHHYESHARPALLVAGAVTFGVSYGLAVAFVAATASDRDRPHSMPTRYGGPGTTLLIPFVGPFLQMSRTEVSGVGNAIYAADGALQIAGAAMMVVGLAWRRSVLTPDRAGAHITPVSLGQAGTGVAVRGVF